MSIYNSDIYGSIRINANNKEADGSPIDMSLIDGDHKADINASNGFAHTNVDGFVGRLMGGALIMSD